ncbi:hypothetical protein Pcinc_006010 [Petrolisthes cinctipes]|uniref:Integrase catalytic domain-containing protein n=1 Tax=Petrolisthes cinctipes TaxID=88211 RepID=A0AAE1GI58_PETCI|nr:hypothetical protein Pcinc_006010 [Petrolisthes cinctipes]
MSSFEQLKAQALELGLSGADVAQYVLQQQNGEREERAREREEREREREEREREREERLAKLQAEKEVQLAQLAASKKPASQIVEEAIPLKEVDSISVAEALLSIFSRVGIPREILSDRGTQFTSQLMAELQKLLGVKPQFTTPYHPAGNGRVERLHGPLKAVLRKLCHEKPREWHRYLVPALFALRELPSDRTGFSAFDLLYGRSVRGPLTALKDLWEDRQLKADDRTSLQYVIEMRNKLQECAQLAAQQADVSTTRYKTYFDKRSQDRQFKP